MGAVEHLSRARQVQLLGALRNLEERLKLSTAQTLRAMERGTALSSFSHPDQVPEASSGAAISSPNRSNSKRITNAQVSQTLRRLGKAMTAPDFKLLHYNLNPVTLVSLILLVYFILILYYHPSFLAGEQRLSEHSQYSRPGVEAAEYYPFSPGHYYFNDAVRSRRGRDC